MIFVSSVPPAGVTPHQLITAFAGIRSPEHVVDRYTSPVGYPLPESKPVAYTCCQGVRLVLGPDHPFTKKYEKLSVDLEAHE